MSRDDDILILLFFFSLKVQKNMKNNKVLSRQVEVCKYIT